MGDPIGRAVPIIPLIRTLCALADDARPNAPARATDASPTIRTILIAALLTLGTAPAPPRLLLSYSFLCCRFCTFPPNPGNPSPVPGVYLKLALGGKARRFLISRFLLPLRWMCYKRESERRPERLGGTSWRTICPSKNCWCARKLRRVRPNRRLRIALVAPSGSSRASAR